jgi:NADPH:quinone reductase-like Zn-dependent oxidoreductase
MGIVGGGAYAEYLETPADHAVCMPQSMTFLVGAAVPEVYITAHDALERLGVVAAEWVLVHAIGSGVGTAALQLIGVRGAHCVGTSRTEDKLARARTLGMEYGVNTSGRNFAAEILRATDGGAAAAIDLVGGSLFPQTLECMASRGRVIVVGLTGGRTAQVDLGVILRKRLRIEGTVLRSRSDAEKTRIIQSFRDKVLPLLAEGRIEAVVDRVFTLDEVRLAHEYLETNANFGKVVVQID